MPTISTFFGIVIRMYYDDHAPPHFHAIYGNALHRDELRTDWRRAEEHQQLQSIEPLE